MLSIRDGGEIKTVGYLESKPALMEQVRYIIV